jgi:hypothetical protein
MSSPVDALITPLSFDEIRASIYNVLAATGVTTSTWKPGAVVRTIISGVAIVLAGLSAFIALLAASAFLPLATGEWLRLVALYVFNVVRIEATFATGSVTLVNAGGGVFSAAAGDLKLRNPTTHKTYVNISPVTLGSGATLVVPIAATEVGAASTSFVGEITEMITVWAAVTCSNANPVIGSDTEGDAQLRIRCTEKLGSLSPNGPADAYRYIARSARRADGSAIGVTRVRSLPTGNGNVSVYVAGPTGTVTGTVGDLSTDLGAIDDQLQKQCVPLCVTCTTNSTTTVTVDLAYRVWLYNTSGMTVADILAAIAAEVTAYFASMPIGGDVIDVTGAVYHSELEAVIGRARKPDGSPLRIVRVVLDGPADDVPLTIGQVPVLGNVIASVAQISAVGI